MVRAMLEVRALAALLIAAGIGTWGLRAYPVPSDDLFLAPHRGSNARRCSTPWCMDTPRSGSRRHSSSCRS